ncbi:MAG: hypothetical protein OXR84_07320 [Magnetovibrio sp.]|nr:hypothetical protein [Magnetovibrio sp.]
MDVFERRAILQGTDNPGGRVDYVAGLQGEITLTGFGTRIVVAVRYVPDRYVVTSASFDAYLKRIEEISWASLEEAALTVVKDISNEMLTRWAQVNLKAVHADLAHVARHDVTVEDRQPGWRNDDLLYRLAPL